MVGIKRKKTKVMGDNLPKEPKLAKRAEHRKSTIYSGRTIGEQREQLETASERIAIHEKAKRKKTHRIVMSIILFLLVAIALVYLAVSFINMRKAESDPATASNNTIIIPYNPTIEIIDEGATTTGGHLTSRMKEFIGQVELDLRELGYTPTKAVIPAGAIREVDFYIGEYTGFIKMTIDRGAGVSAEDADRMIRYLATEEGVADFEYIDVRLDERKAYWK